MFNFLFLASLGLLSSVYAHIPVEKGVLVLDDHNFDDAIAANEFLLVEFYAPWCGHCKKLAPEWDKAASELASAGDAAKLAKVDATIATGLAEKYAIKGFPTIAFFRNGKKTEYNAGRTAADIVAWLKKQSGPAAKTIESASQLQTAQDSNEVVIVGCFESTDSDAAKKFLTVAGGDDVNTYVITSSSDVKNSLSVSGDSIVILKKFDDKRNDLALGSDANPATMYSFILGNSVPLVQTFSQEAAKKIFASPIQKHVLFFTDVSSDHHSPTISALTEVAKTTKGKALVVNVPSTEDRVMDYFGIKKNTLPTLVVVDMAAEGQMKKYPYTGELTADAVLKHVDDVLNGALKATLKSEAASPEDQTSDVVVLRGTTFNDIVLNNDHDVLVEFYAPWCGHCKKLSPIYDELGAKYRSNSKIVIAKMDSTANEIEVPGVNVKGFPTIYFFPGTNKKAVKYDGARELDDFVAYLEEHATNLKHDEL